MCQRWKPFYDGTRCDVELVLKANNIEVNNQQATAALLLKDVQKEFEDFWNNYKHDPIAGKILPHDTKKILFYFYFFFKMLFSPLSL